VAVLTPEERLKHNDQTVEEVKQRFLEATENGWVKAVDELSRSDEVDSAFEGRLREINDRLRALPDELEPTVFDREQLHELHTTLHQIRDLMDQLSEAKRRLDTLNELLIRIEVIRHIIRDALDEYVAGVGSDAGRVIAQLKAWLPRTPQKELGRLVGVDRRTLYRWSEEGARPQRRLALVAELVAILRHSWTEPGVLAWFDRPNRALADKRPISLLDDPSRERDLISAARATRSQYAT
jgi:uncharacterized protein (DUF2384 family)